MRRSIMFVAALLCLAAASLPTSASAFAGATKCGSKTTKVSYSRWYYKSANRFGTRQPGRNIRRYGLKGTKAHVKPSRCADLKRSIRTFRRWFAPPRPTPQPGDQAPTTAKVASTPHYAGGRYSIPAYIVNCESGGDYNARNASGAYGAYQIMPGTASAYGCDLSTPAGQDTCAAKIYSREGAAPWSCG
jgi:membrane-bound lytic murein transglycosylase B